MIFFMKQDYRPDSPIDTFSQRTLSLVNSEEISHKTDIDASGSYEAEEDNGNKFMCEINPGIIVKSSMKFEISEESLEKGG